MSYGCPHFASAGYRHNIVVDARRCIGCAACIRTCPREIFTMVRKTASADEARLKRCVSCFQCIVACPVGAIGVASAENPQSAEEAGVPTPAPQHPTAPTP